MSDASSKQDLAIFARCHLTDAVRDAMSEISAAPVGVYARGDWFEVRAAADASVAEVYIYGDIGSNFWDEEQSTSAIDLLRALGQIGKGQKIDARINSFGGSVADGLAIYNLLANHPGGVDVWVDGYAVSIASLIAMAGQTVHMAANSLMMIHAPLTGTIGNAVEHRRAAEMLDRHAEAMASAYQRNAMTREAALALLLDGEDHWYTAEQALAAGLVEEITETFAVAAMPRSRFQPPAAAAANQPQEASMPTETTPAAPEPTADNVTEIRATVTQEIAARNREIRAIYTPHLKVAGVQALLDQVIDAPEISVDAAGRQLLAKLGEDLQPVNQASAQGGRIEVGVDSREKVRAGISAALSHRMGIAKDDTRNEYRGRSLTDIAEICLAQAGVDVRGMTKTEIANRVLASHSTSDFPLLLADAANKRLQAAYNAFPSTWRAWCAVGSVADFKTVNLIRMGSFNSLALIKEGGEYSHGTVGEEREQLTAATKGKMIRLTRQMIVNDDLNGFGRMGAMLGRAAARTVNADAYGIINSNAAMSDGVALFHANHANLAGSGGAISVATLGAGRAAMRKQTPPGTNATDEYLNIQPRYLLTPVVLEDHGRTVVSSPNDTDTAGSRKINPIAGWSPLEVISDPVLDANSATAWYLAADPMDAPLVEVHFLDGNETPFVDSNEEFSSDAIEWKVRLDYGVKANDFRGGFKNAGA